jgi:hypothetical protein
MQTHTKASSLRFNNFFVIPEIPRLVNPAPPKRPNAMSLRTLEAMPGFWKGRASTRREMAKTFRDSGDMEAGNRHDREANKYEAIAEDSVARMRRIPSAPRIYATTPRAAAECAESSIFDRIRSGDRDLVAVGAGFEPAVRFPVRTLS